MTSRTWLSTPQTQLPGRSNGFSANNPFDDSHEIPHSRTDNPFDDFNAVPLQEIPRLDAYGQPAASNSVDRTLESIKNGNHECSLCKEPVVRTSLMWNCEKCYHVTHYKCAERYYKRYVFITWNCPDCEASLRTPPKMICWCGKTRRDGGREQRCAFPTGPTPNSCNRLCHKKYECPHGIMILCPKECHLGRCQHDCPDSCAHLAVLEPPNTAWGRLKKKMRKGHREEFNKLLSLTFLWLIVFIALWILVYFHIRWQTRPDLYPNFADRFYSGEFLGLLFGGVIFLAFALPSLAGYAFDMMEFFGALVGPQFQDTASGRRWALLGKLLLVVVLFGSLIIQIFGIFGGPDIFWFYQMRNSCQGYNSRVGMNIGYHGGDLFKFRSIGQKSSQQFFYFSPRLEPQVDNDNPYQYYHRLSGKTASKQNLVVDVDYDNKVWRVLELNNTDEQTRWLAYTRKELTRLHSIPRFPSLEVTQIMNGTWGSMDENSPHFIIPELDYGIANIKTAMAHCETEPFIRVFDIEGITDKQAEKKMSAPWTNKFDPKVVMRTASFGHGRQDTDMCIRPGGFPGAWTEGMGNALSDNLMVPFAILVTTRMRLDDVGKSDCGARGKSPVASKSK